MQRLLWLQKLHEVDKISFETFWYATITDINNQTENGLLSHIDHNQDDATEEAKWFTQSELNNLAIYPTRVTDFVEILRLAPTAKDPFLGIFL